MENLLVRVNYFKLLRRLDQYALIDCPCISCIILSSSLEASSPIRQALSSTGYSLFATIDILLYGIVNRKELASSSTSPRSLRVSEIHYSLCDLRETPGTTISVCIYVNIHTLYMYIQTPLYYYLRYK